MVRTPIIILAKERPLQLADMIASIERTTLEGSYRIIICDNGSTQPEMVALLKSLSKKHKVLYNKKNLGFPGFNIGLRDVDTERFLISDPDIVLNPKTPPNWISFLGEIMDAFGSPKVGLALNVNYPDNVVLGRKIALNEADHWARPFMFRNVPCYWAAIDTTMSLHAIDSHIEWTHGPLEFSKHSAMLGNYVNQSYNPKYPSSPARVAGDFLAEHTGWMVDKKYEPDFRYYLTHCDFELSSTLKHMLWYVESYLKGHEDEQILQLMATIPKSFGPSHPDWKCPSFRSRYNLIKELIRCKSIQNSCSATACPPTGVPPTPTGKCQASRTNGEG